MTGMLLGDGGLVKKYTGGGTYLKFAQGQVHLDYLNHVFSLFKVLGIVLMDSNRLLFSLSICRVLFLLKTEQKTNRQ